MGRLTLLVVVAVGAAPLLAQADGVDYGARRRWHDDRVREDAQRLVMRRDALINRDPELTTTRRSLGIGPHRQFNEHRSSVEQADKPLLINLPGEQWVDDALTMLGRALGYEVHIHPSVDRYATVRVSKTRQSLARFIEDYEASAGIYVDVFHAAGIVMARANPKIHQALIRYDEDTAQD